MQFVFVIKYFVSSLLNLLYKPLILSIPYQVYLRTLWDVTITVFEISWNDSYLCHQNCFHLQSVHEICNKKLNFYVLNTNRMSDEESGTNTIHLNFVRTFYLCYCLFNSLIQIFNICRYRFNSWFSRERQYFWPNQE